MTIHPNDFKIGMLFDSPYGITILIDKELSGPWSVVHWIVYCIEQGVFKTCSTIEMIYLIDRILEMPTT